LEHKKTYKTDRPVNSASISPIRDHVVLGGGQEAIEVIIDYLILRSIFCEKLGYTNCKSNRKI
jgi:hypothetical protein